MSFPIANRSESGDPEGEANPEGEAVIRGETGIEGLKSGQRARGVDIADAEAKRISEELRAERDLEGRSSETLKKQVGNKDPMTVARRPSSWASEKPL